jgi:UDP-glucose 4-epimerase
MNLLVLGGNGFIGTHLVDRLLADGHEVRVFDKYEERYRKPLAQVDYRFGEFGNRGLLAEALQDVDIVFHLISTSLPKTSNDDPAFDVSSNVVETLFLLEQCVAQRTRKVVFISSGGTVYGRPDRLPIGEESPTNPECSYGITKLTIEKYLALYLHLHGLEYTVVRPSNPYGSRQNPHGIQGAVSVFLGRIAEGKPIEIWGDGEVVRDYLYVDDLVDGICRAAFTPSAERVFNVGSGEGLSLNRLVAIMRDVTRQEVRVNYTPARSFDVPAIYLDIGRASNELSWKPAVSIEEGLLQTWRFVRDLV